MVELLVVIAIIGALATIVLYAVGKARSSSRDGTRIAEAKEFMGALEIYYVDNSQYPASGGSTIINASWSDSADASWPTLQTAMQGYMQTLPKDPQQNTAFPGFNFAYFDVGYGCSQQWYMLVFKIENPNLLVSPGVVACNGTNFQYGAVGTGIITMGVSRR